MSFLETNLQWESPAKDIPLLILYRTRPKLTNIGGTSQQHLSMRQSQKNKQK